MSQQETVSQEEDLLMRDTEETSNVMTAILNSRLFNESGHFTITDITVTEVFDPASAYYLIDGESSYTRLDEDTQFQMADFTEEHLQYIPEMSSVSSTKYLLPISPLELEPVTEEKPVTSYFASFRKKYQVTLTLRNEDGRQEQLYKVYDSEDVATSFKEDLEENKYARIQPKKPNWVDVEAIPFKSFKEGLKKNRSEILLGVPISSVIVSVLLSSAANFPTQVPEFGVSVGVAVVFGLTFLASILLSISSKSESVDVTKSMKLTPKNTVETEHYYQEKQSVAPVTVQQTFKEDSNSLQLTVTGNSDICWNYEVDDAYLFSEESVVDFYLNLGVEKAEEDTTTFIAYLSPLELDTDAPQLQNSTSGAKLYLHPEDPHSDGS